jgi:hypothetical protein
MSNDTKIRDGFRVKGPNTADGRIHIWYMPTLEEAQTFAENIAKEVDAEYDIYEYVGSVRQIPLEPRPIEFVPAVKKK